MRKLILSISLIVIFSQTQFAQDPPKEEASSQEIKTGWNFGALPALGFDSNLGLLYGGIISLYDYGDGSRYPDYNYNLYLQLSRYTKGSMDAIIYFDSYSLVPDKHFIGRLSYNTNGAYPFYGFNGGQSVYNSGFEDTEQEDFITQVYYKLDRKLVKGDIILQDKFGASDFNWMLGIDMAYYKIGSVDIKHLNDGKDEEDLIYDTLGLYDNYVNWGLISDEEKDGGFDNSLKFGLVYDTRDRLTNPMKGIWAEVIARVAPEFLGNYDNFARLSINYRHYLTLIKDDLSFAYRIWYEGAFGETPFYSRQYLTASNYYEGMGGSTTLRGVLMNRVVGKQTAIANAEFRWKALRFRAINQNFYLGFNLFTDYGYVLEDYNLNLESVSDASYIKLFSTDYKKLVSTGGLGLKLVMNDNFVVSADYAKSFDESYGATALYVQIGYIF